MTHPYNKDEELTYQGQKKRENSSLKVKIETKYNIDFNTGEKLKENLLCFLWHCQ